MAEATEILIVDDHAHVRLMLTEICRAAGYSVRAVPDGPAAVAAARTGRHLLILLDIHMPGMDGIAVAQAIRAMPGPVGEVPIIAVTGDEYPETRARCYAAGVTAQIAKPIMPADLLVKLAKHMELVAGE